MLFARAAFLFAFVCAAYGCQFEDPLPAPIAARAMADAGGGDVDERDAAESDADAAGPGAEPGALPDATVPPADGGSVHSWVIGTSSVEGRPIIGELYGSAGPLLFLVSAIHGNESIAQSYAERVRIDLLGGLAERYAARVFFISLANPEGRGPGTRESGGGFDLNRNFPAAVGGPIAASGDPIQGEARAIIDALAFSDPSAVVSVHCCGPTFDPDGSGGPLADKMREAVERRGLSFPELDLPAYTGSLGSYASEALGLPTATVEFARGDELATAAQLEAMRAATETAVEYVRAKGSQSSVSPENAPFEIGAGESSLYRSGSIGRARSDLPIRSEWSGVTDDRRVLILSGLSGESQRGEFVAEYLRRDLLHRADFGAPELSTQYVTQLNPDAVFSTDDAPLEALVDAVERLDLDHPEARALLSLIGDASRGVTVLVEDGEADAVAVEGPRALDVARLLEGRAALGLRGVSDARSVRLVGALTALGVTVVYLQVATEHFEDQAGPTNPPSGALAIVEALRRADLSSL